jgi:hypothetical protein
VNDDASSSLGLALPEGWDNEQFLSALSQRILVPQNEAQETFCKVWQAAEFLASDGFEALLEQHGPLDDYSAAFRRVGLLKIASLFDRVRRMIPQGLGPDDEAYFPWIRDSFEPLKALLYEYYDLSDSVLDTLATYVRENRDEFSMPLAEIK